MKKTFTSALLAFTSLLGFGQVSKEHHPPPVRASFYADKFEGRLMSNGHRYHAKVLSAASLQFPVGTKVVVTNVRNKQSITLTITDRGPWHTRFKLDLSKAAFDALGLVERRGWGWVTVERFNG
jgi:rare lipoprotein A